MESIIKDMDYDYLSYKKAIRLLCEKYPFLMSDVIGKSVGGRDIISLKIGRSEEYVLLCAAFHGSEHITANLLLKFTENLCSSLAEGTPLCGYDIRSVMTGRGVIIIPVVNPDGVEISLHGTDAAGYMRDFAARICKGNHELWNANLRGVDINHNFDADWETVKQNEREAGIYTPSMTRFGGYKPESEPETQALVELCNSYKIRHAVAFHSQGEVIYADTGGEKIPRMQKMAEILSTSCGYAIEKPEKIATSGGFKDWFIRRFHRPAFTVEIGKGKNPLPTDSIKEIYTHLEDMLILSLAM